MKIFFATVFDAIKEIKKGKMLILVDNPKRENEADLYIPADKVSPSIINTMIKKGGGLVCVAITQKQAYRLSLPLMVDPFSNTEKTKVNFTVSVNAKEGITTGVSAYDRAKTIKIVANPKSSPKDLTRPGHIFGLVSRNGGVLKREGHTEAAVDLARIAGFNPAGVLCEILGKNGKMASVLDMQKLAHDLKIKIISIDDLTSCIKKNKINFIDKEATIKKTASSFLPTKYGKFQITIYKSLIDNKEHVVLQLGNLKEPVLTRIHSKCLTGDTLFSLRCDCGLQLEQSMKLIYKKGSGIIIYLNQEGRGIGITNKIKAYALQDKGNDTVEANYALGFVSDLRQYNVSADILKKMKISRIDLLTNNPDKKDQLNRFGIKIAKRIPLEVKPNSINKNYLLVKKQKMLHDLKLV